MSLPIPLERDSESTLQEQIYRFIRDRVLSGCYPAGLQLPSTRDLADGLRVSRNTTVLAYQWLSSEGYIETRQRAGTYTRQVIPDDLRLVPATAPSGPTGRRPSVALKIEAPLLIDAGRKPARFDFWYGRTDAREFPIKVWARMVSDVLAASRGGLTDYAPQAGIFALREAISGYLSTAKGMVAAPEQILITGGTQDALNIISRLLIEPGAVVAVETPGYRSATAVFRSNGADIAPIRIDGEGIIVPDLAAAGPKLIYTTPSHQFPTGAVMPLQRRQALLKAADDLNAYIIEDDYDGEIIYDRPPLAALAALDRNHRVLYVGTFSKSIGAGLRLGFLVVPPDLSQWATAIKSLSSYGQPWTEQAALAAFIREGHFRIHLRRIRTLYRARRDALMAALREWLGHDVAIDGSEAGLHLVVHLPRDFPTADYVSAAAHKVGVALYTPEQAGAADGAAHDPGEQRLVLGYAAMTPSEIGTAIRRVADVIGQGEPRPPAPGARINEEDRTPVAPHRRILGDDRNARQQGA